MLNNGDIIRITDFQIYIGEDALNVYFYEISGLSAGVVLLDLLLVFEDTVMNPVADLQVSALQHLSLRAENVTNGIDLDTLATNAFGEDPAPGPPLPSYVAAGFDLLVGDKTTRSGGKRFTGIGEERVANNVYNPVSADAELVQDRLAQVLTVTGLVTGSMLATPVIVGRFPITGHIDLSRVSTIIEALTVIDIRSQVSRRS
jgi:hypothetical protein